MKKETGIGRQSYVA